MVLPGVMSIASPAAALDIWNSMLVTTLVAPVVPLTLATTEPLSSRVPLASASATVWVYLALSLENRPVESAEKANTEETTTKAINTIAVSSPVMPRWSDADLGIELSDISFFGLDNFTGIMDRK